MMYINPIRLILSLPNQLKCLYKKLRFNKFTSHGQNLTIGPNANVFIEQSSSVDIGDNCDILGTLMAKCGAKIRIGKYTTIRSNSFVGSAAGVDIGDYVIISNNVHIIDNNNHPTPPITRIDLSKSGFYSEKWHWRHSEKAPIVIENNTWICERSTILKGVTIGEGSIVACDSVVTKSVPPYTIVAGNPAQVVKKLDRIKENIANEGSIC